MQEILIYKCAVLKCLLFKLQETKTEIVFDSHQILKDCQIMKIKWFEATFRKSGLNYNNSK